jgi:hypothetical protein
MFRRKPERSSTSFVRTIFPEPDAWRLPFHQDETLLGCPLLNVWIPLTQCGTTAPGLEVVVSDKKDLLTTSGVASSSYVAERLQINEALVVSTFGRAFWHPSFEPGDAMVFYGTTVHRTHYAPNMSEPRTSVELRLV